MATNKKDNKRSTKHYKENKKSSNIKPTKAGVNTCAQEG